jgi:uncharacterized protein (TIGR02145 family)
LENYLGGADVAGGKMKSTGTIQAGTGLWQDPNTGATNSSGFTAFPGGSRGNFDGSFFDFGGNGYWWSSTEYSLTGAGNLNLDLNASSRRDYSFYKAIGISIRCLRD